MVTGALIRVGFLEGDEGLSEVTECVNKGVRSATFFRPFILYGYVVGWWQM